MRPFLFSRVVGDFNGRETVYVEMHTEMDDQGKMVVLVIARGIYVTSEEDEGATGIDPG